MYTQIGCAAVAPFAAGHGPVVCARDAAGVPRVLVTQDNYPMWGTADHQSTIAGGMPHESAAGAMKMAQAAQNALDLP